MSRYELTNQCSIVINLRKQLLNDVRIFLTDRTYRSHFSLDFSSHLGNNLVIPYGQAFSTDVKIKVQSSWKIENDDSDEFDYALCVNGKLEADMENLLNCVPPWMSDENINKCSL